MERKTVGWFILAIIIVITGIILLRFVATNGDSISSMPGSASNWFQQVDASSSKGTDEPVIIIRK